LADCGSGVHRLWRCTPRFGYSPIISAMSIVSIGLMFAGCAGNATLKTALPRTIVARVGTTAITTRQLTLLTKAKASAVATSTGIKLSVRSGQYRNLRDEALSLLIRVAEARQECRELAVRVTTLRISIAARHLALGFGGNDQLVAHGLTLAEVRLTAELRTRSAALAARIGRRVHVSESQVSRYYRVHMSTYTMPSSRKLGLILVRTRAAAVRLRRDLVRGDALAALAQKYSLDRTSARIGGLLIATSTGLTKPLARVAFALKTGELSAPTRTAFGWAIVRALAPIHAPRRLALQRVRTEIRRQLLSSERTQLAAMWTAARAARFCNSGLEVRPGYMPPQLCTPRSYP
jgi:PPIC-type PPIASE domain